MRLCELVHLCLTSLSPDFYGGIEEGNCKTVLHFKLSRSWTHPWCLLSRWLSSVCPAQRKKTAIIFRPSSSDVFRKEFIFYFWSLLINISPSQCKAHLAVIFLKGIFCESDANTKIKDLYFNRKGKKVNLKSKRDNFNRISLQIQD